MATIWEETKTQTAKMKGKPFKEKLGYFWEYYKIHTIIFVGALGILISIIHAFVTAKDYALSVVLINSIAESITDNGGEDITASWISDLNNLIEFDQKEYEIAIDATLTMGGANSSANSEYASMQKLAAMMSSQTLDIIISNTPIFEQYSQNEYFYDLRNIYTADQIDAFKEAGLLYYTDAATFSDYDSNTIDVIDQSVYIVDHHDPESMKDPVPVGFFLLPTTRLGSCELYSYFTDEDTFQGYKQEGVMGIPVNTPRLDNVLIAVDYFLN